MQDDDIEEDAIRTRGYAAGAASGRFRRAKFSAGWARLRWDDAGQLIDGDGRLVNCVWKTGRETAMERICAKSARRVCCAVPIRTGHPENEVRLIDVLLRPEVLVFEPLWTVIPGNKSDPAHPVVALPASSLLDTDFTVNDELVRGGYAVKPIAGRCGSNIDLVSHQEELWIKPAASLQPRRKISIGSCGACRGRREIYSGLYVYRGRGNYGGTCRGDDSLVIKEAILNR